MGERSMTDLDRLDALAAAAGHCLCDRHGAAIAAEHETLAAAVRERDELRAVANDAADTMHAGTGAMAATLPVILAVRAWRDTPRDPKRPRVNAELEQAVMDAINDFDEYAARLREDGAS